MTLAAAHRSIFVAHHPDAVSDGLRVAVKDVFDIAGEVTTCGSRALADAPAATADAEIVKRLKAAGCAIVGRTTMHELAYGVTGVNCWSGTPINPAYPHLIPGGSSSGSAAAVAAGLVDFAIGTDTGGSIRMPATCCGVVGLKPSFGRVSRTGAIPHDSSLDCVGPFARSVAMIERAMAILVPDWSPATPGHPRIGWVETRSDPPLARRLRETLEASFETIPTPLSDLDGAMTAGVRIIGRETALAFAPLLASNLIGGDVQQRLSRACGITDEEIAQAETVRRQFAAQVDAALDLVDVLALPALPRAVPTLLEAGHALKAINLTANCRPFNLSGHPAIALPAGTLRGRPIALQLVGRRGGDERLCAIATHIAPSFSGDYQ